MSQSKLPPPPAPLCLIQTDKSSQKGGTLIAEDVVDLKSHLERICDPDKYRPNDCQNCHKNVLHVHDYRERKLVGNPLLAVVRIVRFICVNCKATWRILPAFVARCLWRSWPVVEAQSLNDAPPHSWPSVPERTKRRWNARLRSAADSIVELLKKADDTELQELALSIDPQSTRKGFVRSYASLMRSPVGQILTDISALIHRLAPGVRVM